MLFPLRRILLCGLALCFLAACTSKGNRYSFPTTLPSEQALDATYNRLRHDLSPLPEYHFQIMIPVAWKTLATKITKAPEKGGFDDVGIFREPGDWMKSDNAPIKGEISVSVLNVEGDKQTSVAWLEKILEKNAAGLIIVLNHRSIPSASGEVSDILIKYESSGETIISRLMALKRGDEMFVITGSDTEEGYKQTAEVFAVAVQTFKLDPVKEK